MTLLPAGAAVFEKNRSAARLHQDVDHVAVLIHRKPEILLLAVDSNEDLVQVPNVAEAALAPLQRSNIVRTDF